MQTHEPKSDYPIPPNRSKPKTTSEPAKQYERSGVPLYSSLYSRNKNSLRMCKSPWPHHTAITLTAENHIHCVMPHGSSWLVGAINENLYAIHRISDQQKKTPSIVVDLEFG